MAETFFFYDLETSGISPRTGRVMQFAGQRTDMNLKPIGEPVNRLIKLPSDILPEPDAVLITGITPQQTLQDGETEPEFMRYFTEEIAIPGTIFVGYNTIRFDDEFMRFMHYRNFYDPYEWQWADNRSKWDLLDVVRMTRALRPEGIEWPFASDGSPTNRLEFLTKVNKLDHQKAHDALSDVYATIAVADLIRTKQPKLFNYLVSMRGKKEIATVVESGEPFVYSSGRYSSKYEKTTVVQTIGSHPSRAGTVFVYDLREDPSEFISLTIDQLIDRLRYTKDEAAPKRLPVKQLQYNHCPAIAPLGVLDEKSRERLQVSLDKIKNHRSKLLEDQTFSDRIRDAFMALDKERQVEFGFGSQTVEPDEALYDGFYDTNDKRMLAAVRGAKPEELLDYKDKIQDKRLQALLLRYKARNYASNLSDEERSEWESWRTSKLMEGGETNSPLAKYFARLGELAQKSGLTENEQYLLEELQLYGQSLLPDTY